MTTTVTIEHFTINDTDWGTCTLLVEGFAQDDPDICAYTADGEYLAPVTASVSHAKPAEGCLLIENYGGGEELLAALVDAGLVEPTGRTVASGFVDLPEARPLADLAAIIEHARQAASA